MSKIFEEQRRKSLWKKIGNALDSFDDRLHAFFSQHEKSIVFSFEMLVVLAIATFMIWVILDPVGKQLSAVSTKETYQDWMLALRIVLTIVTLVFYFLILRKIWMNDPVHRDRKLFSNFGMGMALYSLQAIAMVILLICTIAYVWSVEGIYDAKGHTPRARIVWEVVSQFADPGNIPNSQGGGGHAIALISAICGIFCLSGLALSSFVGILSSYRNQWNQGLIRYKKGFNNYVVVIGVNEQAPTIIKQSLRSGADYILVQTRKNVELERSKLQLKLNREEEEKIVFYYGERTSGEDIGDLLLEKAREIYILGEDMGDENEDDHDSFNMRCLELISQYCERIPKTAIKRWKSVKLLCHVDLEYQSTYAIFKSTHIYKQLNANLEFVPFNVHEIWAKKVLVDNYAIIPGNRVDESKVQKYLPIDCYKDDDGVFRGIGQDTDKAVHLIIAGMNQMGVAIAIQTALLFHLPNYHTKGYRTTISFIDEQACKEAEYLKGRYAALFELCRNRVSICGQDILNRSWEDLDDPMKQSSKYSHLGENFMDIQWEFIEGNIASEEIRNYLSEVVTDKNKTCTIAVCFNNPQKSIATALYLPEIVLKRVLQVLVYQKDNFDLIQKVATGESEWKRYEKLKPFGMMENCYKGDVLDNVMAKLALTVYKRQTLNSSHIDALIEYSNRMWEQEGIVNKWANINLVDSFASKLRSVGLTPFSSREDVSKLLGGPNNIRESLVRAEHSRWLTEKLTMGYRPLRQDEMDKVCNASSEEERKAIKERMKTKSRAHLDICSYDMLKTIDPGVLGNDKRVIENVVKLKFYKIESEMVCRLALRPQNWMHKSKPFAEDPFASTYDSEKIRISAKVLDKMEVIRNENHVRFWMGETPVTQGFWELVMGKSRNMASTVGEDYPITNVSKNDIDSFLTILNDKTGLRFRLPEKDEWHFAALGGVSPLKYRKDYSAEDCAWFDKKEVQTVRQKKPNRVGLYDMMGNVWEWTQTMQDKSTYFYCGGSFRFGKNECDVTDENESWASYWIPEFKSDDIGFRLLLPCQFEKNTSPMQAPKEEKEKMYLEIMKRLKIVEGGSFVMGNILEKDRPSVTVEMSSFKMADAPLTQRQWMAFMNDKNPSMHKGDDLPVENVSYRDVMVFMGRLNDFHMHYEAKTNDKKGVFDLPTEAQWEYAARGGNKSQRYSFSGNDDPDVVAWHFGNTKSTHPVRRKNANELGLYDMCGNVWEWCKDYYQPSYYAGTSCLKDPTGPEYGYSRVFRGGSWRFTADECRLARTCNWTEDYKSDDLGFRIVLNDSL